MRCFADGTNQSLVIVYTQASSTLGSKNPYHVPDDYNIPQPAGLSVAVTLGFNIAKKQ